MTFWLRLTTQGNRVSRRISAGMLFCLYAVGSHPFDNWQKEVGKDRIIQLKKVEFDKSLVASLMCFQTPPSFSTTNISCPADPSKTLGIKSPFLVFILKTTELFSFEVQILDDRNVRRWLKWSTIHKEKKTGGGIWLQNITNTSFGSSYIETLRIQICGRELVVFIRWIRRVYFTDREYLEDEIFNDF
uniref:CFA20 domain-containing protein n=1 Tax=Oryzias latipes TaxID=8090 RepID=A0A3P9MNL6_ORYLA